MDAKTVYESTRDLEILYVEDEQELRESTTEILQNYFCRVDVACDGEEALELYLQEPERFDLVISDIAMPKKDGIEMAREMLKRDPLLPVIFITAYSETDYLLKSIEMGVSGFILKPIAQEQFLRTLYKASSHVVDRKCVLAHVDNIEELNLALEAKNKELERSLRMLDTIVEKEVVPSPLEKNTPIYDDAMVQQIEQLVSDDLYELRELHTEIDRVVIELLNAEDVVDITSISYIAESFKKYAASLAYYTFFNDVASEMSSLASTLRDVALPDEKAQVHYALTLLESFLFVLEKWQNELEKGDIQKINFFDDSLINDMKTISSAWIGAEEEETQEIEFF